MPREALGVLMSLVVTCLVLNWGMITLTHMKFRAAKTKQGEKLVFKALFYPYANYFCLFFMFAILYILVEIGSGISVLLAPFWVAFVRLGYLFKKRQQRQKKTSNM
jgi:aromatic amino acid transport protein AroP